MRALGDVRMCCTEQLLTHSQRLSEQRRGLFILFAVAQVRPCFMEQLCGLRRENLPLGDKFLTYPGMGQAASALLPGRVIHLREGPVGRSYCAFCPQALGLCVHLVFEYSLHQPVQAENPGLRVAADQGKLTQLQDGLIEHEGINGYSFKYRAEFWCALHDDLFRDSIRVQKSTEPQEIGGGGIGLLYLRKG